MNTSTLAERPAAATQTRQRQSADPEFERLLQKPSALRRVTRMLAERLGLPDDTDEELIETLKATAFRQREGDAKPISDAQMLALLIIANEYGLNPWTKEIYAFPDRGGIQPIVGYDGWVRIINEHPQFDGMEFDVAADGAHAECRIFRKDRSRPTAITEFLVECKRNTDPWNRWPRRMIRNKAVIQCARLAFGFALQDDEEGAIAAGVIPAIEGSPRPTDPPPAAPATPALPACLAEDFERDFPKFQKVVASGKKTAADLLATLSTKATFTQEQRDRILALKAAPPPAADPPAADTPALTFAQVADGIAKARNVDELEVAGEAVGMVADEGHRGELRGLYDTRRAALLG